jgi:hypothetical protein
LQPPCMPTSTCTWASTKSSLCCCDPANPLLPRTYPSATTLRHQ